MLKHIYINLIATFLLGFLIGVLVFLQGNTGQEGGGALPIDTKGFTVSGYTYGGCADAGGCPSYRVMDTGAYIYLPGNRDLVTDKTEGVLTKKQLDVLRKQVSETNYDIVEKTAFTGVCASVSDGVAYRYDVDYNGKRYTFDACKEKLTSFLLFKTLETFFAEFEKGI